MDTSDFRKPRPDYPLYPQKGIWRPFTEAGFKPPKGRKGRKPKRGKVKPIPIPKPPKQPSVFTRTKIKQVEEDIKMRREEFRLQKDIAEETSRYRVAKKDREEARQISDIAQRARTEEMSDRLLRDQQGLFQELLERQRQDTQSQLEIGERRQGALAQQYQDFIKQVMSKRVLPEKEDIPLHFFQPIDPEAQEAEEDLGEGMRLVLSQPRAERREEFLQQTPPEGGGGGTVRVEPEPQPSPYAPKPKTPAQQFFQEQIKPPQTPTAPKPRGGVGQVTKPLSELEQFAQELGEVVQASPTLRETPAAEKAKLDPEKPYEEGEEAVGFGATPLTTGGRKRRGAVPEQEQITTPTPRGEPYPTPRETPTPTRVVIEEVEEETPRQIRGLLEQPQGEERDRTLFDLGKEWAEQRKAVKLSTNWEQLSATFLEGRPSSKSQFGELYLEVKEPMKGGRKGGVERTAGFYKVREMPAREGTGRPKGDDRDKKIIVQHVLGSGEASDDIGTINPYKEAASIGYKNPFQKGLEEGSIVFHQVQPQEEEEPPTEEV